MTGALDETDRRLLRVAAAIHARDGCVAVEAVRREIGLGEWVARRRVARLRKLGHWHFPRTPRGLAAAPATAIRAAPTPEEIRAECEAIRAEWPAPVARERDRPRRWTLPTSRARFDRRSRD